MASAEIEPMSDYEVALMDSLKTVMEVLTAKEIVSAAALDKMLERQREVYPEKDMPGAHFVVDELRRVLTDPDRARLRDFLRKPSEGMA
jgi:hypothetical protein